MSSSEKRCSGTCPNCQATYFNRYKPRLYPNCNHEIGGSYVPKAKKPKVIVLPAVSVSENVVSVSTTNRNDRCFVSRERDGKWMCFNESCKQRRAIICNSGCTVQFRCDHIDKAVDHLSEPQEKHEIDAEKLSINPCLDSVREEISHDLYDLAATFGTAPVIQIPGGVFAVYAAATAGNPLGFCHVKCNPDCTSVTCCGKNCRGIVSKAKQEKTREMCIHAHTLLCALKLSSTIPPPVSTESGETNTASETLADQQVATDTNQRETTLKVKMLF